MFRLIVIRNRGIYLQLWPTSIHLLTTVFIRMGGRFYQRTESMKTPVALCCLLILAQSAAGADPQRPTAGIYYSNSSPLPQTGRTYMPSTLSPSAAGVVQPAAGTGSLGLPPVTGTYSGAFRENIGMPTASQQPAAGARATTNTGVRGLPPVTGTYSGTFKESIGTHFAGGAGGIHRAKPVVRTTRPVVAQPQQMWSYRDPLSKSAYSNEESVGKKH